MSIKWEPTKGKIYVVLFDRLLEVYSVEKDGLIHSATFDEQQTSFDFISDNEIVISDNKGRLTHFTGIN